MAPVELKNKKKEKDSRLMSPVIAQTADPSDFDKYESEFKVLDETDANQSEDDLVQSVESF